MLLIKGAFSLDDNDNARLCAGLLYYYTKSNGNKKRHVVRQDLLSVYQVLYM